MNSEEYKIDYLKDFDKRSGIGEVPGSADMAQVEWRNYRTLIKSVGKQEAKRLVKEEGFPLQDDDVGPKDLGETAYKHLCVVAEHLLDKRGEENSLDTVESYVTKNRFDRWLSLALIKEGRLGKEGSDLDDEWNAPQIRQPGYENSAVMYPKGVDNTKIFGVAKPHRYLPAQTMRYLDYLRQGKIQGDDLKKFNLDEGDLDKCRVEWDQFEDVVKNEKTLDDIAIGIAVKTAKVLKGNGLNDEQVGKILLAGYNPGGPLWEHGNIPEVHDLWSGILNRLEDDSETKGIKTGLEDAVRAKISSVGPGYDFNYDSSR